MPLQIAFRSLQRLSALRLIRCRPILPLVFALLLFPPAAPAQAVSDEVEDVIRVRTDLVLVPVTVTDSRGRRIIDLEQRDFALRTDAGKMKLEFFSVGTEQVAMAFLLDASGSARNYLLQQREAALSLFSRFGSDSEVAVLPFGDRIVGGTSFTNDIDMARSSFTFPAVSNRRTAIFDSVMTGLSVFGKHKTPPRVRRIMILTSDGLDTSSGAKPRQVIGRARSEGVSIYVIHFPIFIPIDGRLKPRPAAKGFRDLAEQTGGRYFQVGDASSALRMDSSPDLTAVFNAIEEDLAGQYLLGFYPVDESRDGRFHPLQVEIATNSKRKLKVKTLREGFILKQP
ncbi:MAG TPA: VWA domain-containing protein [Pyrinomonadaceae bacterium]|nr:VWA domain-containing protein [Pyrinomonadaceae bacterium]